MLWFLDQLFQVWIGLFGSNILTEPVEQTKTDYSKSKLWRRTKRGLSRKLDRLSKNHSFLGLYTHSQLWIQLFNLKSKPQSKSGLEAVTIPSFMTCMCACIHTLLEQLSDFDFWECNPLTFSLTFLISNLHVLICAAESVKITCLLTNF